MQIFPLESECLVSAREGLPTLHHGGGVLVRGPQRGLGRGLRVDRLLGADVLGGAVLRQGLGFLGGRDHLAGVDGLLPRKFDNLRKYRLIDDYS